MRGVTGDASYHAIYLVLNDQELFAASLRSVYPHITGATVVTSHDFDRYDDPVVPDATVPRLLSRELDPERKVNVLICAEGSEVAMRNRAMAFARPPRHAATRSSRDPSRSRIVTPDWFWIIDADEIYDEENIRRLKRYVVDHPARVYRMTADDHWRSWNWRIEELGSYVVLVKPGVWFAELRHEHLRVWQRVVRKLGDRHILPLRAADRLRGVGEIPRGVAIFHHGSYLGDRARIAAKLSRSGHRDQHLDDWLDRVWDGWSPDQRNLHPFDPSSFPIATHVDTEALPMEIRRHPWPPGWLEPV